MTSSKNHNYSKTAKFFFTNNGNSVFKWYFNEDSDLVNMVRENDVFRTSIVSYPVSYENKQDTIDALDISANNNFNSGLLNSIYGAAYFYSPWPVKYLYYSYLAVKYSCKFLPSIAWVPTTDLAAPLFHLTFQDNNQKNEFKYIPKEVPTLDFSHITLSKIGSDIIELVLDAAFMKHHQDLGKLYAGLGVAQIFIATIFKGSIPLVDYFWDENKSNAIALHDVEAENNNCEISGTCINYNADNEL